LFKEYAIQIGVSIDGPLALSSSRVDWNSKPAFRRILDGIELLKKHNVPFAVIAVVGRQSLPHAHHIYKFAADLGCWFLGINIEETEGPYHAERLDSGAVRGFWSDLYKAWRHNPVIQVRELTQSLYLMSDIDRPLKVGFGVPEIFPCVSADGDVVLLSPELVDNVPGFVIGNVLRDAFDELVRTAGSVPYVREFLSGIAQCRGECPYFWVCGGGAASNRFFEHGRLDVAETECCRNRVQLLTEAMIGALKDEL